MEKLKIEAGKFYRTHSGKKAYVAAIVPDAKTLWPVMGWVFEDGYNDQIIWKLDGADIKYGDANSLVAEWVETKRIKGWVNLYRTDNVLMGVICNNAIHLTKESADHHGVADRFACIEIDVLEGQGLDGSASNG